MAKIALFANGPVGAKVAQHLLASGDEISLLYLHPEAKRKSAGEIIANAQAKQVISWTDAYSEENIAALKAADIDFIITVYWAYLLKDEICSLAKDSLNFHPALLPINRGWYPHVHSILDGSALGVTLHQLAAEADTGDVWVQKEIFAEDIDTAGSIYAKLQDEIYQLFEENWSKIRDGQISPTAQDHSQANYHSIHEIKDLDLIELDKTYSGRELINLLKARTFGSRSFAYYLNEQGEKIYLHLSLSKE
ncbi:MAG: formyltransferase family protein [Candidatus Melainabacteria bacterium]|nr:formyltransferase family protein [Candidatus Melainabacteria bacterium]